MEENLRQEVEEGERELKKLKDILLAYYESLRVIDLKIDRQDRKLDKLLEITDAILAEMAPSDPATSFVVTTEQIAAIRTKLATMRATLDNFNS